MTNAPHATIVCIATGPSLTQEDCDFVRGKADVVIAINDAHRIAPWADVLFSADRYWYPLYRGVPEFAGKKIGIGSSPGKANPFHAYPEIDVYRNTGYEGLDTNDRCLRTGSNSGYAAINLAVHFGASRVVLLGYNMSHRGGKAHFFGDHPPQLSQTERNYPTWRVLFETMVQPLADLKIEVINCTPETSLSTFPVRELREVLTAPLAVAS